MKRTIVTMKLAIGLLLVGVLSSQESNAQTSIEIGPRIGYEVGDIENAFIGADMRIGMPALPVKINPYFDYYLTDRDELSLMQFGANALYEFGIANQVFTPYAGLGLGVSRWSWDELDESATETGINVLFGARFGIGQLRPFAQAQITTGSPDFFTLGGGLLFRLGQ